TRTPQAATTSAAAVEMLNVPDRSPPVPHVSNTSSGSASSATASRRIVCANPTSSAGRSPFMARPTSSPAICAGAASPRMITAMASAASLVVRSSRRPSFSIRLLNMGLQLEEVPQDSPALVRQDRLGVELDSVHRPAAVAQAHDQSVFARPRRDVQFVGPALLGDDERVIARG